MFYNFFLNYSPFLGHSYSPFSTSISWYLSYAIYIINVFHGTAFEDYVSAKSTCILL